METPGDTVTMVTDCPEIPQKLRIEELPVHRDKWVAALYRRFAFNFCSSPLAANDAKVSKSLHLLGATL
jgi:hypothetical protein